MRFSCLRGFVLLALLCCACRSEITQEFPLEEPSLYMGSDLSYVNEVEDCGATFRVKGHLIDPYILFDYMGANIARYRLWHNPQWTQYSTFTDLIKSISRAKAVGMKVLLDFHYSDNWADPGDQIVPTAWNHINEPEQLSDSLYQYTYSTLIKLDKLGLMPDMVQVGNEINSELLLDQHVNEDSVEINWVRNALLINKGLQAVRDASANCGKPIESMLHIAQPEHALDWFEQAHLYKVLDYDWIGLSYYPKWSKYPLNQLHIAIDSLIKQYNKRLMVVETAYPYCLSDMDEANNILMRESLLEGYPATPMGQRKFMIDLTKEVIRGGGEGVIYWEAAWVSSSCTTRWGKGSHWDNATFFDASNQNEALPVFDYLDYAYWP